MPHQVIYDVVGTLIDQQMIEPWQRCFYTIMANYNALLEAVDCRIHSVRFHMVLELEATALLKQVMRADFLSIDIEPYFCTVVFATIKCF